MPTKKKIVAKGGGTPASNRTASDSITDNLCFIIMPYGYWPDYYYDKIYYPAIKAAGLRPRRADDVYRPSAITHDIWVLTSQAKIILADLSGKNPNVFYELGLAHAMAKPGIMVTDSTEDIPFDLRSLRVIVYDKNEPDWGKILQHKIKTAIKEVLISPRESVLPTFLLQKQMDSMKEELTQLKGSSKTSSGKSDQTQKPRLSPNAAMEFVRISLEKKAPDDFILSWLQGNGFDDLSARSILEMGRSARKLYFKDGVGRVSKQQLTSNEAVEFARRYLKQKAPDKTIRSMLQVYGFEEDSARSILDLARSKEEEPSVESKVEKADA